jgi:hypothetical protein
MRKFASITSVLNLGNRRNLPVLLVWIALVCLPALAPAQTPDFTLQAQAFDPPAIDPGGVTTSNITVGTVNGFTGSVALSCQVTSQETPPTNFCTVSPATVQPPGGATATINAGSASPGFYTVTITGTEPLTTHQSLPQNVTILSVSPGFTITVQTPMDPSSVSAGNQASGTININPLNGYISPGGSSGSGVTLSCASISPLVTLPPICSFNPPNPVVTGTVTSSTITITTFGPITTQNLATRSFYALWLPLPMLALAGFGAAVGGKRSRKAWGLLALFVVSGTFLLLPACTNTTTPTTITPNGITPSNTYTFTIVGVDADKTVSSNSTSSSSTSTVKLTVTAPTTN